MPVWSRLTRLASAGLAMVFAIIATPGELLAQATPPAAAPAQPGPSDEARYSFHRSGELMIRLDSVTGQLASCGWANAGWACKLVPDERIALEGELGRLQKENSQLKRLLLSKGVDLPPGMTADPQAPVAANPVPPLAVPDPTSKEPRNPADADVNKALDVVKHVWRRLVEMMSDLSRDLQKKI